MGIKSARKAEIKEQAKLVNEESEKYQLVHASSAIEIIIKNEIMKTYRPEFKKISDQLAKANDNELIKALKKQNKELQDKVSAMCSKIRIDYLDRITAGNARVNRINDTIRISLPKEMSELRMKSGEIDFQKMKELRVLMAHELGHVLLHTDYINQTKNLQGTMEIGDDKDLEANLFADELIQLRKNRNNELYKNKNYELI